MENFTLNVEGMSCGHCSAAVERLLSEVDGVKSVKVDLEAAKAQVEAVTGSTTRNTLVKSINDSEIYSAS